MIEISTIDGMAYGWRVEVRDTVVMGQAKSWAMAIADATITFNSLTEDGKGEELESTWDWQNA